MEKSDSGSDDMEDWSQKIQQAHENMTDEFNKQDLDFDEEQEENEKEELQKLAKVVKKGAKKTGKKAGKPNDF